VLLHRNNTRVFEPLSLARLRDALSEKGRVVIFTGKESPLQTVRIFQRARWLIGYHGAGLANAYFMNNSTRIVEISTYEDIESRVEWRTNMREVTKYGQFETLLLRIPIQQIMEANGVHSLPLHDVDHFVKDLRYVKLTSQDVQRIMGFFVG
jgi:hypothetical protein